MRYKRVENPPNQEFCIRKVVGVFSGINFEIELKYDYMEKFISGEHFFIKSYFYEDIPNYADGLEKHMIKKALELGWLEDTKPKDNWDYAPIVVGLMALICVAIAIFHK